MRRVDPLHRFADRLEPGGNRVGLFLSLFGCCCRLIGLISQACETGGDVLGRRIDFSRRGSGVVRQFLHFGGDDGEILPGLAGACGFDGRVQGQEVGLRCDGVDRADDRGMLKIASCTSFMRSLIPSTASISRFIASRVCLTGPQDCSTSSLTTCDTALVVFAMEAISRPKPPSFLLSSFNKPASLSVAVLVATPSGISGGVRRSFLDGCELFHEIGPSMRPRDRAGIESALLGPGLLQML
jgi:hypothetical protein